MFTICSQAANGRRGTPGFLFAMRLRGRQVGLKRRPSVRDKKKAPALHLARKGLDELEMKTMETTLKPWRTAAPTPPRGLLRGGKRRTNKKGPGGRRNALIRLDSAKEIQGFSLLYFGRALLDEARIWLNLDLAWRRGIGGSGLPPARDRLRPALGLRRPIVTSCPSERASARRHGRGYRQPGSGGAQSPPQSGRAARARLVRERRRQRERGRAPRRDADRAPLGQEGIPGRLAREGDDLHRPHHAFRRRHARARAPALRQGAAPLKRGASRRARSHGSEARRSPRSASIRPWSGLR